MYTTYPSINGNFILGNSADYDGGGIFMYGGSFPIEDNTINSNEAKSGGGIYMEFVPADSLVVQKNIIKSNSSHSGGGIYLFYSSPDINKNIIEENLAGYQGGGIYIGTESSPSITVNSIAYNNAESLGGGIYEGSSESPIIGGIDDGDVYDFNTICGNSPDQIEPLYPNNFISIVCD